MTPEQRYYLSRWHALVTCLLAKRSAQFSVQIRSLSIRRYRGLTEFDWLPSSGVNCLIGPGDSGKSSVLAAVSLLLAPYPIAAASEFDYFDRNVADGFEIQACLAVDDDVLASERTTPPIWGWRDGHRVELPEEGTEPVIVVRARGTAELEVVHEIIPPAGDPVLLTVGFRKKLLLARLVGEDRASRDLRVTQGSLLDRLLGRADLRGVLAGAISIASAQLQLPQEVSESVQRLAGLLDEAGLPHDLHLGLAAIPGLPLPGLLTLLQGQDPAAAIPLAYSGAGTRQLVLLELSAGLARGGAVVVVDEPERGLEPYRQSVASRRIVNLSGASGQAFVTTHAPAVLEALPEGAVWRMAECHKPVQLVGEAIARLLKQDPAAFFAKVPLLCEGDTEVGFNEVLLSDWLSTPLDSVSIHLVSSGGQPAALGLLDGFRTAGFTCAGFVDNEHSFAGRGERLAQQIPLFAWNTGRNIEEAIARHLSVADLWRLPAWGEEASGTEARHLIVQVRDGIAGAAANDLNQLVAAHGEVAVRTALAAAMDRNRWFKTQKGGRVLATQLLRVGMPAPIRSQLDPFYEQLRGLIR